MSQLAYRRILLKLSGEALMGGEDYGIDPKVIQRLATEIIEAQAACATEVWKDTDQGIWEARGDPKHYVSSKLMSWIALDRAAKLAHIRGDSHKGPI